MSLYIIIFDYINIFSTSSSLRASKNISCDWHEVPARLKQLFDAEGRYFPGTISIMLLMLENNI